MMNRNSTVAILTITTCAVLLGGHNLAVADQPEDVADLNSADSEQLADAAIDAAIDVSTVELATAFMLGTWVADISSLQSPMFDAMPPEQVALVRSSLEGAVYHLTHAADGTFSAYNVDPETGASYEERGTWYVAAANGQTFELHNVETFDSHEAPDTTPDMEQVQVLSWHTIVMSTVEDGTPLSMQFHRAPAE